MSDDRYDLDAIFEQWVIDPLYPHLCMRHQDWEANYVKEMDPELNATMDKLFQERLEGRAAVLISIEDAAATRRAFRHLEPAPQVAALYDQRIKTLRKRIAWLEDLRDQCNDPKPVEKTTMREYREKHGPSDPDETP